MQQRHPTEGDATPPASRLVKEHEAAAYLCLSLSTIRKMRREGRGPKFLRFDRSIRYDIADLDAYRERNQVTPWADPRRQSRTHKSKRAGHGA